VSQFTWLDRKGNRQAVVGEPGEWNFWRLSRDGRRAAVSRNRAGGSDLWILETERGVSSRFTSRPGVSVWPVWSPDQRTIVFSAAAPRNMFRKEITGAGTEQRINESSNTQWATDWSGDGHFVLYQENAPGTQIDLWILLVTPDGRPAPGTNPRPYLRTPFNEWMGRFSPEPNPRWVAYQSDESGRYEVYVDGFPEPHGKTRISTGGGYFPQWGAQVGKDGRELFYVSPDNKLMSVNLAFAGDSVEPSAPHERFALPTVDAASSDASTYEVAPDGNRFLVRGTPQQSSPPLTVIVNWPGLLKKGAAGP
jgi:eukaryotic-like serine/threonine-protein kinase